MLKFENFTDAELATCVDEYFKRAIAAVRHHEKLDRETVHIEVKGYQSYSDSAFTVKHSVRVGDSYSTTSVYAHNDSDNAVMGARICANRLLEDLNSVPKTYSLALPAPEPDLTTDVVEPPSFMQEPSVEDAEFAELDEAVSNDNSDEE